MQAGQQSNTYTLDVNEQNLTALLERSQQVPVIIDFWAPWCQPCQQMAPVLDRLVAEQAGGLILAKVNADEQQAIAAQFGVRSLPTLKLVFQGRLVSELSGLQTEAALREWLAPVLGDAQDEDSQQEAFAERIREAIAAGHGAEAEQALRQALTQEPELHTLRAVLVEYLLGEGRRSDAESALAEAAEDVEVLRPFRARFALLDELGDSTATSLKDLSARLAAEATPEDLYAYGLQAAAAGQFREGLEALLTLLRDHPGYRDGIARAGLLKIFECLPKGDPLASEYRRRMFNYLY
ncbi:tetratricopeptide repeat protein [Alcanivorax limicola]|uniref:tetratricopeptide repeat protein n=1 Tax=Alcanivorax limicola TaxID=2874102 RepID=UPI001CBC02DC|nr:tetratricopeptide repeat protein [Alcanivorax limicola]